MHEIALWPIYLIKYNFNIKIGGVNLASNRFFFAIAGFLMQIWLANTQKATWREDNHFLILLDHENLSHFFVKSPNGPYM